MKTQRIYVDISLEAKKIDAVEMTRKIREEHASRLAGKSHAERIAFYREQAMKLEKKIPSLRRPDHEI